MKASSYIGPCILAIWSQMIWIKQVCLQIWVDSFKGQFSKEICNWRFGWNQDWPLYLVHTLMHSLCQDRVTKDSGITTQPCTGERLMLWSFSLINTYHQFQETEHHRIHHRLQLIPSSLGVTVLQFIRFTTYVVILKQYTVSYLRWTLWSRT